VDIKEIYTKSLIWMRKNQSLLLGIGILLLGLFLIINSREIIINSIILGLGLICIYFGLRMIGLTKVTDYIDETVLKIKKLVFKK